MLARVGGEQPPLAVVNLAAQRGQRGFVAVALVHRRQITPLVRADAPHAAQPDKQKRRRPKQGEDLHPCGRQARLRLALDAPMRA